jgi:hypothetical protein
MDWQREFLGGPPLRVGHRGITERLRVPRTMAVDSGGIVDTGLDPVLPEKRGDVIAKGNPNRKQVVDARTLGCDMQGSHSRRQQFEIAIGVPAARLVPHVQIPQLDPQERGLKPIEPLVEAELDMVALAALAQVAQTT